MSAKREGAPKGAEFPRGNSGRGAELDDVLAKLRRHQNEADASLWKVGELLNRLVERGRAASGGAVETELWEERRDERGRSKYRSLKEFIENETSLGYTHAIRLMHVAPLGRDAFVRFGLRRLHAVALAPESARPELLAACESGETAAQIEARSRAARAVAPRSERRGGRPPSSFGAAPRSLTEDRPPIVVEATRADGGRFVGHPRLWDGQRVRLAFIPQAGRNRRRSRFEIAVANGEDS